MNFSIRHTVPWMPIIVYGVYLCLTAAPDNHSDIMWALAIVIFGILGVMLTYMWVNNPDNQILRKRILLGLIIPHLFIGFESCSVHINAPNKDSAIGMLSAAGILYFWFVLFVLCVFALREDHIREQRIEESNKKTATLL